MVKYYLCNDITYNNKIVHGYVHIKQDRSSGRG